MQVPPRTSRVLCQTSLWMLVPLHHSPHPLFSFFLANTLGASLLHWGYYSPGSVLHHLDCYFSVSVIFFLYTHSTTLVPLPFITAASFAAHTNLRRGFHLEHLVWHLVFRALAFFWCLHYCAHTNLYKCTLYLGAYGLQAMILYQSP